jgi:hypothetical protein
MRASTNFSTSTKTPKTSAGDLRSKNGGKQETYVFDIAGHEAQYSQGTESGLLGAFEFKRACTAGDSSCDTGTRSMGAGFCNFNRFRLAIAIDFCMCVVLLRVQCVSRKEREKERRVLEKMQEEERKRARAKRQEERKKEMKRIRRENEKKEEDEE